MKMKLNVISSLEEFATNLDNASLDAIKGLNPEERAKQLLEAKELESRKTLSENIDSIVKYRDQRLHLKNLRNAQRSLNTGSVTRASNRIAEISITDELTASIRRRMNNLGLTHLPIEIERTGSKGSQITRLKFSGCDSNTKLSGVLSEGEQRVIAISAFLAELCIATHRNAVVFDDPVCSLDHNFRKRVIKEIVKLSEDRQVIIFTHDMVFLKDLHSNALELGVDITIRSLRRMSPTVSGLVDDLPDEMLPLGDHIARLQSRLSKLKDEFDKNGESLDFHDGVRLWYSLYREAWEKSIEESLFNKVVQSFSDDVMTLRLREVEVGDSEWEMVLAGMTRAGFEFQGHRKASGRDEPLPSLADMRKDLDKLEEFRRFVKEKRKGLKKRRKKA